MKEEFVKNSIISLQLIAGVTLLALIYGFVTQGRFIKAYLFNANFLLGASIILVALIMLFLPTGLSLLKADKLTDHTTIVERYAEIRKQKQQKAYQFLFLGLAIVLITGIIEWFCYLIVQIT